MWNHCPNSSRTTRMLPAVLLTVGLLLASPVAAQEQSGGGRLLDANLSPDSRINSTRPESSIQYRLRNLEVTGNVAGGRGFRGTVGYTAAGDFRGKLGSNRLFRFMSGSAYSSPDFIRFRDRFEQIELGQSLGLVEYRRSGGQVVGMSQPTYFERPDFIRRAESRSDFQFRLDQLTAGQSLNDQFDTAVIPMTVGTGQSQAGDASNRYVITSSELQGLRQRPFVEQMALEGMPVSDRIGIARDFERGYTFEQLDSPFQLSIEAVLSGREAERIGGDSAIESGAIDLSVNAGINNQYENIIETMSETYRSSMGSVEQNPEEMSDAFANRYRSLVDMMEELDESDEEDVEASDGDDRAAPEGGIREELEEGIEDVSDLPVNNLIEEMAAVLRHDGALDTLTTGADSQFDELMQAGTDHIAAGEYLWAERKFTRALRISTNHPLALVGKAHAQVGAGLHNSAALTLHMVFKRSPEVIDIRFAPGLLPQAERLSVCTQQIREQIQSEESAVRRGRLGMLLAYLGHQAEDDAMISEGLNHMRKDTPRDAVLPLVERLWGRGE